MYLNQTQNPLEDSELSLLIASITGETDNEIWINSKSTTATQLQAEINSKKTVLPLEEQIPKEFHEFLDVFLEEKAAQFPEPRSWDHKIELKEGFIPKSFKTYNLTPQEQIELDKFLKENTEKAIYDHRNRQWPLHFSLWTKKMVNYNLVKTIDT